MARIDKKMNFIYKNSEVATMLSKCQVLKIFTAFNSINVLECYCVVPQHAYSTMNVPYPT